MEHIPLPVLSFILSIVGSWNHIVALAVVCKRWKKAIENAEHYITFQGSRNPKLIPGNAQISDCLLRFAKGWKIASLDLKNTQISEFILAELIILQPWLIKIDISNTTSVKFEDLLNYIAEKLEAHGLPSNSSFNLKEIRLPMHEISSWPTENFLKLINFFPNLVKFYAGQLQVSYEDFKLIVDKLEKLEILFCSIPKNAIDEFYQTTEIQWSNMLKKSALKILFLGSAKLLTQNLKIPKITVISDDIFSILQSLKSKDDLINLETWLNLGGDVNYYAQNADEEPIIVFFPWKSDEDLMVEAYRLMIMHGLDLSKHDTYSVTSTYLNAAIENNYKELAKLFIHCGVDAWPINRYNSIELPAMAFAAAKGDPSWIQLLIDEKIPINCGPRYCSPLCLAVKWRNAVTFKFLCNNFEQDFRCPIHKNLMLNNVVFLKEALKERNFHIPSVILYEVAQYSIEFDKYDDSLLFITILAEKGVASQEQEILNEIWSQPNQWFGDAASKPLMYLAAKKKAKIILEKLIELKFDINIRDEFGRTCVSAATIYGYFDVISYLLENGANINLCDNSGNSPLHYAAKNKYIEIFQFLIQHNADLGKHNNDGKTPLMLAKIQKENEIVQIFEKNKNSDESKCIIF
ncbi:unnamed protein product [Blepharisma stoltei]|uniref:F-box domain-containing protein n=1 Tax=Blepharisma stoltei TaxID=1481888 RepID=A0AAU9KAD0_9CILI|nr:unnamed protein product [Blepharisma stoltei]